MGGKSYKSRIFSHLRTFCQHAVEKFTLVQETPSPVYIAFMHEKLLLCERFFKLHEVTSFLIV